MNLQETKATISGMSLEDAQKGILVCDRKIARLEAELNSPNMSYRVRGVKVVMDPRAKIQGVAAQIADTKWLRDQYSERVGQLRHEHSLGQNLKRYMEESRMTQEQLAAAIGGDPKAIREYMHGKRKMRPSTKQLLEEALKGKLGREITLD